MRILHAYILKEMLKALALALAAVAGVVCFGLVLQALQQKGLGPLASLMYMGLSVPMAVYLALPLAAVLAATLVYGRLAAEHEVQACWASGIPVSSLLWPAVLLAMTGCGLSLSLAAWPLPESSYAAKALALMDLERHFFSQLNDGRINVKESNIQLTVDRVIDNTLYGPTVKYRGPNGQTYCYAQFGRVEFDKVRNEAKLALWDALVLDELHAMPVRSKVHSLVVPLPTYVPRKENDLSLWHLALVESHPELADRVRMLKADTPEVVVQYHKDAARAEVMAEMHKRLATALGCFGLVLMGAGLGMYFHSGHLLTAFGVALVPWFGSYLMTWVAERAASRAVKNPEDLMWIIWAPNALVVILGLLILAFIVWLWCHPTTLQDRLLGRK
ncbi:MAG: LptF/LptG family permease [Planctomycetota bacterium]|nr:LptF/LptG family permease [Planctomycetota bacterium]